MEILFHSTMKPGLEVCGKLPALVFNMERNLPTFEPKLTRVNGSFFPFIFFHACCICHLRIDHISDKQKLVKRYGHTLFVKHYFNKFKRISFEPNKLSSS